MERVCRETYSGPVLEKEYYGVERVRNAKTSGPNPRFKTEAERKAHREKISRKKHERLVNENFTPNGWYVTVTFGGKDRIEMPQKDRMTEEDKIAAYGILRKEKNNYIKRLKYKYPDAVIFGYMGLGRDDQNPHIHLLIEGIPDKDFIESKWEKGRVIRIEHLRTHCHYDGIDCGRDYRGLANYLFDHWEEAQGSHRWSQTKTTKQPQREDARTVKRVYTEEHPPRTPKGYILVETYATRYGYICFRYVLDPRYQDYERAGRMKRPRAKSRKEGK